MLKKIKMYKTAAIILGLVMQLPLPLHAQKELLNSKSFPSPNAAALGKYADYPVSLFTGVPAINIPLYSLKDGPANIDLSLSYHASGIKVSDMASWVGTGWILNAGGVITRTVRSAPDEVSNGFLGTYRGPKVRGYYTDSGLSKLPPLDKTKESTNLNAVINNIYGGYNDGESDIYTINVDGLIGKFVFDENRNVRFLTQTDLKLEVEFSAYTYDPRDNRPYFIKWIATTPRGTKYIFGVGYSGEGTWKKSESSVSNNTTTAWYLTHIIYPNTTDTVKLMYTGQIYSYNLLDPEFTYTQNDSLSLLNKYTTAKYSEYDFYGVRLHDIRTRNFEIRFIANTNRSDIYTGIDWIYAPRSLDKIQIRSIKSTDSTLIDQINFSYDYFKSLNAGSIELSNKDTTDTKRLKLVAVQKGIAAISKKIPDYTFEYYEDIRLPRRCSYDVDHWGYANGAGGDNIRFTPPLINVFGSSSSAASLSAFRKPKFPFTQAFTLKKITDPLGVTTSFEFEPNMVAKSSRNGDTVGGGIRIKRIITENPILNQKQVKRFEYKLDDGSSSGVLLREPIYWAEVMNEYKIVSTAGTIKYAGDAANPKNMSLNIFCKFSQSPLPLQDYQGYSTGYKQVKELFGENGENGYKIYNYNASNELNSTTRLKASNFLNSSGSPTGNFNEILPENLQYVDVDRRKKFFPFEPEQVDLSNGLLLSEKVFDKSSKLLMSESYTYDTSYKNNYWLRGFLGAAFPKTSGSGYDYAFTYYKYRVGNVKVLSKKTVIIDTLSTQTGTIETKYLYESSNHLQPTRQITTNSTGDTLESVMRYSFDFDSTAISGGVISEMKKQNILAPLRTELWKNNALLSCTSTEYAKNTMGSKTVVLPTKTYTTESKKVISSADIGFNKSFANNIKSLTGTSLYVKQQGLYSYNDAGLLQQQSANNTSTAYIWDYKNTIPIAVATNAMPTDIAYTSFEADGTGNWTIGSTNRINTEAFTGTQCYDLSKGNITKTGLNSSKTYWLNYWAKTGASVSVTNTTQTKQGVTQNNWTLWTKKITGTTNITISGTGSIDEVRMHPDKSQMKSSTYIVGIGMSSQVDANNNVTLYEYDELNRLKLMRDGNRNIMKTYCYNYSGAPIDCDGKLFYNTRLSRNFTRNNCPSGCLSGTLVYTVPAGKYSSSISQVDADAKAQTDINTNGQTYANANGNCTPIYARISYENVEHTYDNITGTSTSIGDVVVRFYQDSLCTQSYIVYDYLPVKFYSEETCFEGTIKSTIKNPSNIISCNGSFAYLERSAILFHMEIPGLEWLTPIPAPTTKDCSKDYYLENNDRYKITY